MKLIGGSLTRSVRPSSRASIIGAPKPAVRNDAPAPYRTPVDSHSATVAQQLARLRAGEPEATVSTRRPLFAPLPAKSSE